MNTKKRQTLVRKVKRLSSIVKVNPEKNIKKNIFAIDDLWHDEKL